MTIKNNRVIHRRVIETSPLFFNTFPERLDDAINSLRRVFFTKELDVENIIVTLEVVSTKRKINEDDFWVDVALGRWEDKWKD